jgi:UDP-2,3-diacylglucosamine pyrophosphatase LpxH
MKREIVILGDVEIGGGTLTDDFISDKALVLLIRNIMKSKTKVDLVLNGDTFDFLKCPLIVTRKGKRKYTFPRHITSTISLQKLDLMYQAHTKVFDALHDFVQRRKNRLFFIYGNHDHDLFFPEIQRELKKILHSKANVYFRMEYNYHKVHAEHGHQYDFLNKINPNRPFITYKGEEILSIPWISFGIISNFLDIKERHPFLERITPRPRLFEQDKTIVQLLSRKGIKYLVANLLWYPVRYFWDPTYTYPKEIFRELYRKFKHVHWDVDSIIGKFKLFGRNIIKENKVIVLGHVHEKLIESKQGNVIIHPDTWRDEYILEEKSKRLVPKTKRYVHVFVQDNDEIGYQVVEVKIDRKLFTLKDVREKEKEYLCKAAKQEHFKLNKDLCKLK